MAELADVQDLGSCAERRVGSTPTTRTIFKITLTEMWVLFLYAELLIKDSKIVTIGGQL